LDIDHVLIAVANLAVAAEELEARFGLASVQGGRHPGWGTANRIVPLGETYVELVSVVDQDEAAQSAFGSWVARGHRDPYYPLGWAVRVSNLDAVAQRLRLTVRDGSRVVSAGGMLRWQYAGIEQAAAEPTLPFFIEWGQGSSFPGRSNTTAGHAEITRLLLNGDVARLAEWLDVYELRSRCFGFSGRSGDCSVGAAGEIVLDADLLNR
jgi:Glyoxalase-like domain